MKENIIISALQIHKEHILVSKNAQIHIVAEQQAQGHIIFQHQEGSLACTITCKKDSKIDILFVGNGTEHGAITCAVVMQEPGSHATVTGLYRVTSDNRLSIATLQDHQAPHTTSHLTMRKLVYDQASATYQGMITIAHDAQHADASQHDKTLLVGDKSHATSVPAIEVSAHDVQCAHGSAIGRVDPEQIWYMQSRGIDSLKAEQLLEDGFLAAEMDFISDVTIKKQVLYYFKR